jgi:hypothetical protein
MLGGGKSVDDELATVDPKGTAWWHEVRTNDGCDDGVAGRHISGRTFFQIDLLKSFAVFCASHVRDNKLSTGHEAGRLKKFPPPA